MNFEKIELPGLHQAASDISENEQKKYFYCIGSYLVLLVTSAIISYIFPQTKILSIVLVVLFLISLVVLIYLKNKKPQDGWYNGRAVAESVKTRTWRWMMRAEPYTCKQDLDVSKKEFISDLKEILSQNKNISIVLNTKETINSPISDTMVDIRKLDIDKRLEIYKEQRINNQRLWYFKKAKFNKKRANLWFYTSVLLHSLAILFLLYGIYDIQFSFPISVISTMIGAMFTWVQSKKYIELISAYSLTAHEITLIYAESDFVKTEQDLSEYVNNSENAFSREHTQWFARKDN